MRIKTECKLKTLSNAINHVYTDFVSHKKAAFLNRKLPFCVVKSNSYAHKIINRSGCDVTHRSTKREITPTRITHYTHTRRIKDREMRVLQHDYQYYLVFFSKSH